MRQSDSRRRGRGGGAAKQPLRASRKCKTPVESHKLFGQSRGKHGHVLCKWYVQRHSLMVTCFASGMCKDTASWSRALQVVCAKTQPHGHVLCKWYVQRHSLMVTCFASGMCKDTASWSRALQVVCAKTQPHGHVLCKWYVQRHSLMVTCFASGMCKDTASSCYWWCCLLPVPATCEMGLFVRTCLDNNIVCVLLA